MTAASGHGDVSWEKLKPVGGNGQLLSPTCPRAALHLGVGTECRQRTVTFPKILDTVTPLLQAPRRRVCIGLLAGQT